MANRSTLVGLDVHKESIAVAIAESGRFGEVRAYGTVGGELETLDRVLRALRAPDTSSLLGGSVYFIEGGSRVGFRRWLDGI